jgi:hypothetical protein
MVWTGLECYSAIARVTIPAGFAAALAVMLASMPDAAGQPPDAGKQQDAGAGKTRIDQAPDLVPQAAQLGQGLPFELHHHWNVVSLGEGVPVQGEAHLVLYRTGSYRFWGRFHNAGLLEHRIGLGYAVPFAAGGNNGGLTFVHQGKVSNGILGSRDDEWIEMGNSPLIGRNWAAIVVARKGAGRVRADWDLKGLAEEFGGVLRAVKERIAIIGPALPRS